MIEIGPGIVLGNAVKIGGEAYAIAAGGSVTTTTTTINGVSILQRIHTFETNGTFTTGNTELPCWILIVGGGGGGGSGRVNTIPRIAGGGGGGGGYVEFGGFSGGQYTTGFIAEPNTEYSITVGLGGAANDNGGNSSAFGYTAIGGGRGAGEPSGVLSEATTGGCGGGGLGRTGGTGGTSGKASIQFSTLGYGQGFAGAGPATQPNNRIEAGGGGGAGSKAVSGGVEARGDGKASTISGSVVSYAPGGSPGSVYTDSTDFNDPSTQALYGAGGGGAGSGVGQGGANGVVIVRYPLWLI